MIRDISIPFPEDNMVLGHKLGPAIGKFQDWVVQVEWKLVIFCFFLELQTCNSIYNKYIIRRYTTSFGKSIAWSPASADQ
jgi:hypothetical protein